MYYARTAWWCCNSCVTCLQEAEADNQVKCEAVCAVGRLVAFQSVAAGDWLAPQLISHMVGHGKQVDPLLCTHLQDLSSCYCLGPASGSSCSCTPALLSAVLLHCEPLRCMKGCGLHIKLVRAVARGETQPVLVMLCCHHLSTRLYLLILSTTANAWPHDCCIDRLCSCLLAALGMLLLCLSARHAVSDSTHSP